MPRVQGSEWVQGSGFRVKGERFTPLCSGDLSGMQRIVRVGKLGVDVLGFGGWGFTFRVLGSGFSIQGSGFRVQGSLFQDSGFRMQASEFRIQGSGGMVQGWGLRVEG